MQIWKKNFLVIYGIFLAVVCGSLLLLDGYISRNEIEQWIEHGMNNERSISYLAEGLKEEELSRISMNLSNLADRYAKEGIRVRVWINANVVADRFPEGAEIRKPIEISKIRGKKYLTLWEERDVEGTVIEVDYAENLEELSRLQTKRLWVFCGIGLVFSGIMGLFLYYTMRRINRPVNQIAHELRTPLTGIRGYAEYLMMGKLTEEDIFFAAKQIVDSAKNLEDVTEKLLIMGNVREGALQIGRIDLARILPELEEKYPGIEIDCQLEFLNGDETLVTCLLDNLISNAVRAGRRVKITVNEEGIRIWNNGKTIDEKLLKEINKGQDIPQSRMGRHGYGIQVCQEIAKGHGWKLRFQSSEEEGTEVFCQISAASPKFL